MLSTRLTTSREVFTLVHKQKIPQWRRDQIKDVVLDILEKVRIGELPVELKRILAFYGWRITTIGKARKAGMNISDEDNGFSVVRSAPGGDEYLIIYNEDHVPGRIRWTIAHEIGHIALGHLRGVSAVTDEEAEANYFARELLTPLAVLDELGVRSVAEIAEVCDISSWAAEIRAGDFQRRDWYKARHGNTERDLQFLKQFSKMFDMEIAAEFYFEIAA